MTDENSFWTVLSLSLDLQKKKNKKNFSSLFLFLTVASQTRAIIMNEYVVKKSWKKSNQKTKADEL